MKVNCYKSQYSLITLLCYFNFEFPSTMLCMRALDLVTVIASIVHRNFKMWDKVKTTTRAKYRKERYACNYNDCIGDIMVNIYCKYLQLYLSLPVVIIPLMLTIVIILLAVIQYYGRGYLCIILPLGSNCM